MNFRFQHLFIQVIWFSSAVKVKSESVNCSAMSSSSHLMDCSLPDSSVHGDSPGKNPRVGSHVFLQGIFLTQGLYTGLLHCRQILYQLSYQWSPESPIIQVRSYFAIIYIYIATTFDPSFYLFLHFLLIFKNFLLCCLLCPLKHLVLCFLLCFIWFIFVSQMIFFLSNFWVLSLFVWHFLFFYSYLYNF